MSLAEKYARRPIEIAIEEKYGISYVDQVLVSKVGRPCNASKPKPIAILGRVDYPSQLGITHEITFANNLVRDLITFKNLCRTYNILNLTFQFREDGLSIVEPIVDTETAFLSVFFDANYMHHYYCESPINVCISTNALVEMINSVKNETHFVKIYLRPGVNPNHPIMHMCIHLKATSIGFVMERDRETTIIPIDEPSVLPRLVSDFYPFEFFLPNTAILDMLGIKDIVGLRIANSSTSMLQIMPIGISEHTQIDISNVSSNIMRNNLHESETFNINLSRDTLKKFVRCGEVSGTNNLHFRIHPTEATFLIYKCFNTRIQDQFEVSKDEIERSIHSCIITLVLPRIKLVNGRHNIISQGP